MHQWILKQSTSFWERLHLTETKTWGKDMSFKSSVEVTIEVYLQNEDPAWTPKGRGLGNVTWLVRFLKTRKGMETLQPWDGIGLNVQRQDTIADSCQAMRHCTSKPGVCVPACHSLHLPMSPSLLSWLLWSEASLSSSGDRFCSCCSPITLLVR